MANGLITETITHELHSLVSEADRGKEYETYIEAIKNYLFENKRFDLNKDYLLPIRKRLDNVTAKMLDIRRFYDFIEKTFVYSGKADELEKQNLKLFLDNFLERYSTRLKKLDIEAKYNDTDFDFLVPRGALMHVFYNLLDNSLYWIEERQIKGRYDKSLSRTLPEEICVEVKKPNIIRYFDSGTGVLDKFQYTLFQPMVSGKQNGRGMGMYIVKKFLESFDATISLMDDRNNYGNRYIFEIIFSSENPGE